MLHGADCNGGITMTTRMRFILLATALVSASLLVWAAATFHVSTTDECILRNIGKAHTSASARLIRTACINLYGQQESQFTNATNPFNESGLFNDLIEQYQN